MTMTIAPYLRALLEAGAEVYEVGGSVRDRLLGRRIAERDYLCRRLSADHIAAILKPYGRVNLVGQFFGVIKFSPHSAADSVIDIALPRREFSTGIGHRDFDVAFDPDLPVEVDLGRRDFTMNAIAQNITTGEIVDPCGGAGDIQRKLIRVVFPEAFEEDPLRMLRAIQFAARLEFTVDEATAAAIQTQAALIRTVSAERIIEELRKLMTAKRPSTGFRLMHAAGLLKEVIPEVAALVGLEQDKQPGDDVFDHTMRCLDAARSDDVLIEPGEMHLMFAMLFHDVGKARTKQYHPPSGRFVFFGHQLVSARQAKKWMQRMKIETIGVKPEVVLRLIEHHMFETKASFTDRAIRRFIAKIGKDLILRLLDLRIADNRGGKHPAGIKGALRLRRRIQDELDRKPPFGPKDLAVNGHDLMDIGIPEGRALGFVIKQLVEAVLDAPELNEREILLKLAHKIFSEQVAACEGRKDGAHEPTAT